MLPAEISFSEVTPNSPTSPQFAAKHVLLTMPPPGNSYRTRTSVNPLSDRDSDALAFRSTGTLACAPFSSVARSTGLTKAAQARVPVPVLLDRTSQAFAFSLLCERPLYVFIPL